jgi:hypothetical protein
MSPKVRMRLPGLSLAKMMPPVSSNFTQAERFKF